MPLRKTLLYAAVLLLAWKVVRTDWIVEAPHWYGGDHHTSASISTAAYVPPISPLWQPPLPQRINPAARDWTDITDAFNGGGNYGINGTPHLHPHWLLIALKLVSAYVVTALSCVGLSYFHGRAA